MDSLGQKIKELRKEKNLTQPELARLLNVSNGVISFWENNINEPKATYVKQLAIIFNVSSDYILGLEKWKNKMNGWNHHCEIIFYS